MTDSRFSDTELHTDILNSLLAHVAIIDETGTIIDTNKAWKSFNETSTQIARADIDTNYFDVLQQAIEFGDDYALKILLGLKKVLNQNKKIFSINYPIKTETNSFWFKLTIRPCSSDSSFFIMIHEDITPSMKAKYEKQENEDRFKVKFEQSPDGILITDTNGSILEANQTASNILGWARNELTNFSVSTVLNTKEPKYKKALQERNKSGTYSLELNFIDKQGNIIPTETTSRTYRNPNGKLRAIITFHDVSKRKKIEEDLINTKKFTESALNSIPGVFFVMDRAGNFIRWNENMVTTFGYNGQELSEKNALEFVQEEHKEETQQKIIQCIEDGEISVELTLLSKSGQPKEYSILGKRFVENGKVYIVGTGIDITENKRIERDKKRHQIMMEQLFDNSPVGITIVDTENKIQKINDSFENIFGYSGEEVLGKNIDTLLAPHDKKSEANAISLATRNGDSLQTETIRMHKDGSEVPVLIGSVPVKMQDEIIAIYGIYIDISIQHNYREKISETLREKEALLAELHHRVKNNLALISSLVELQLFDAKDEVLQEELKNIKNRIMTIASIHEVLYQNGNLTQIPLNGFLDELANTPMIQQQQHEQKLQINASTNELFLNINQSIPAGLLLNEVLSLIFQFTDESQQSTVDIHLSEYGNQVHLVVEGNQIINCPKEVKNNRTLHNILIETLGIQLNGTFIWPNSDSDYQKFEFFFTKEKSTSPASNFLEVAD